MKTKTTTMIALTAILATALVFPNIGPAEATPFTKIAMKADISDNLKPKAFGEKTKNAQCNDNPCFDKNGEKQQGLKAQKVKDMKKAAEHNKAVEFMKTFYRI